MSQPSAGRVLLLAIWVPFFGCDEQAAKPEPARKLDVTSPPPPAPSTAHQAPTTEQAVPSAEPRLAPTAIAAQHVLIAYRGAERADKSIRRTKADAQKLAAKVAEEAHGGADFTALVSKYSEDPGAKERLGSLGKFTPDKMHKAFSDAAFLLDVNQVSGVVETPFGFHVIKRNQ